jgi:hypothetical protein
MLEALGRPALYALSVRAAFVLGTFGVKADAAVELTVPVGINFRTGGKSVKTGARSCEDVPWNVIDHNESRSMPSTEGAEY